MYLNYYSAEQTIRLKCRSQCVHAVISNKTICGTYLSLIVINHTRHPASLTFEVYSCQIKSCIPVKSATADLKIFVFEISTNDFFFHSINEVYANKSTNYGENSGTAALSKGILDFILNEKWNPKKWREKKWGSTNGACKHWNNISTGNGDWVQNSDTRNKKDKFDWLNDTWNSILC